LEDAVPRIRKFSIKNFKGIESIEFDFHNRIDNKILTFIGLNESGKTTVLEALSHFITSDRTNNQLFEGPYAQQHIASLIPIHKSAAFTGKVSVASIIELTEKDKEDIVDLFSSNKLTLDKQSIPDTMVAERAYNFQDSTFKDFMNYWSGFSPVILHGKNKKPKAYVRPPKESDAEDLWIASVNGLRNKLPNMAYFPTFLVDMPSKIYLSEHQNEKPVNRYYRSVLQDVLDSIDGGLNLETHVVKRIKDFKERDASPAWFPKFFEDTDKRSVEAVFHKLSAAITKEVLGNWQRVFNRPVSAKQIKVDWNIDLAPLK
jgi:energy-coupling factor transporter ATP-binding protein EcfA2